ncbi:MAG: ATP-binding protein [Rudaea sp.]
MRLRSRLLISHGVVILLAIIAFAAALYAIQNLTRRVDTIAADRMQGLDSTERIRGEFSNVVRALLQDSLAHAQTSRADAVAALAGLKNAIDDSRPYFSQPNDKKAFANVDESFERFVAAVRDLNDNKLSPDESAARISSVFVELRTGVAQLRQLKSVELRDSAMSAREFANSMFALLGALALLLLCVGILAVLRLTRAIYSQVDDLSAAIEDMSSGNYDISCRDAAILEFNALGRHLENMGRQLGAMRNTNVDRVLAEQRRTNAVLDNIDDGLVIFSDEGTIERINPVAERQLGLEPGAATGKRFEDIGDIDIGRHIRQVLASGEYVDTGLPEIRIERNHDPRTIAYTLHRFVETQSNRIGVVMVMRDVTVQHEFDKMRSEFVLRASHELRTPIASIRMGLGLLGEKLDFAEGSRERELYLTVQQELTRMVSLLTDLLDLSRLRVGEQSFERAPTNVEDMLRAACQRFELPAEAAHIGLTIHVQSDLPHLSISRSAFDRVLDNLLNNALRHTPPSGSIALNAEVTPRHVLIHVADTGEGIATAQQSLIFEPFVQIGSKRGGAGLGLAICKEIVHQHGGEISVESQPRRGTTFTIAMPV